MNTNRGQNDAKKYLTHLQKAEMVKQKSQQSRVQDQVTTCESKLGRHAHKSFFVINLVNQSLDRSLAQC